MISVASLPDKVHWVKNGFCLDQNVLSENIPADMHSNFCMYATGFFVSTKGLY